VSDSEEGQILAASCLILFTFLPALYIKILIGYTTELSKLKNYLIAIKKRNLLLREKMERSTNLKQEVSNE